jgi:hypothetical protein
MAGKMFVFEYVLFQWFDEEGGEYWGFGLVVDLAKALLREKEENI